MLNLHELNVFVEAARAENFSVAARRLYLSQPAVSLHIRNLEKQFGVPLFERHGRNISLSEAGKLLLPMARDLLCQVKQIEETMWGVQGKVIGHLSIACSTTVGKYILPRLVAGFRAHYPDVAVEISVMSRRAAVERLLEGSAEIAVVSTHLVHHDLDFAPFLTDQVILIVPPDHPWADGRTVAPGDLRATPFILREATAGTYEVVADGLAAQGYSIDELPAVLTLANAEAIEMSVEAGIGAAFVSKLAAARGLALNKVVEVPVAGMALSRTVYMVRHQQRAHTPLQQAFWDFAFDPAHAKLRQLTEA
jgi:DNA-binding transcriptional LysR family regulator